MPKTSSRNRAERSNHGAAGRLLVDDGRRDCRREEVEREGREREDRELEERESDLERLLVLLRLLDGARLIVLRLTIAQMFSLLDPIIPQPAQNRQPRKRQ
jgi:hypothetical protein